MRRYKAEWSDNGSQPHIVPCEPGDEGAMTFKACKRALAKEIYRRIDRWHLMVLALDTIQEYEIAGPGDGGQP